MEMCLKMDVYQILFYFYLNMHDVYASHKPFIDTLTVIEQFRWVHVNEKTSLIGIEKKTKVIFRFRFSHLDRYKFLLSIKPYEFASVEINKWETWNPK